MSQVATVPQPLLPPCRVCGEKASGFHYGVNTCEACKGFFRRSLHRKEDYKCSNEGKCVIELTNRNSCAACRYKKCIGVGMSKDAIKTGRYTHEKKTKDIEEIKRIQRQVELKQDQIEHIIKQITTVHNQQTPYTAEFYKRIPELEDRYLERRHIKEQMFGPLKNLSKEEYMQIYHSTGIDVDGRREMITHILPSMELAIKRYINFAKAVPGFKELPIEDQIALIKTSWHAGWMVDNKAAFNAKMNMFVDPETYEIYDIDDIRRIEDDDGMEEGIQFLNNLQTIDLSVEETCILLGLILVIGSDDLQLSKKDQVAEIRSDFIECLEYVSKLQRPNEPLRSARILQLLAPVRCLHYYYSREKTLNMLDNLFPEFKWGEILGPLVFNR